MVKRTIKTDVTVPCLCGGTVGAGRGDILDRYSTLVHSLPTCKDYDKVETVADAADFLRAKLESATKG